jgi:hypothetical protein
MQQILLSMSSYSTIFVTVGTVIYFFIVVYSLYCDLKGVDSTNAPNTSERPVITVLPPSSNKYTEAPRIQPVPQAPLYEGDVAPASAERYDRTDHYYMIPEGK